MIREIPLAGRDVRIAISRRYCDIPARFRAVAVFHTHWAYLLLTSSVAASNRVHGANILDKNARMQAQPARIGADGLAARR